MPDEKRYFERNLEGLDRYYLPQHFWKGRRAGISAMIRLKNEEEWIGYCLKSIRGVFDEIVITLQNSTDATEEIIRNLELPGVAVHHYPFDSWPNGPGHHLQEPNSVHSRAYFYNWSLSKTTCQWVCKWDGDMIAFDGIGVLLSDAANKADIVHFRGLDMYGPELKYTCRNRFAASEPRLFRVTPKTFYFRGTVCEEFSYPVFKHFLVKSKIVEIGEPLFMHTKWTKPVDKAAKGWSGNWREIHYCTEIVAGKSKGERYEGKYPSVLSEFPAKPGTIEIT